MHCRTLVVFYCNVLLQKYMCCRTLVVTQRYSQSPSATQDIINLKDHIIKLERTVCYHSTSKGLLLFYYLIFSIYI